MRIGHGQDVVGAVAVGALGGRGCSPARSIGRGCSWRSGWRGSRGNCRSGWAAAGGRRPTRRRAGRAPGGRRCNWASACSLPPGAFRSARPPGPPPPPWTLACSRSSMKRWHLPQVAATCVRIQRGTLVRGAVDAVGAVAIGAGRHATSQPHLRQAPGRARSAGTFPVSPRGSRRRSAPGGRGRPASGCRGPAGCRWASGGRGTGCTPAACPGRDRSSARLVVHPLDQLQRLLLVAVPQNSRRSAGDFTTRKSSFAWWALISRTVGSPPWQSWQRSPFCQWASPAKSSALTKNRSWSFSVSVAWHWMQ